MRAARMTAAAITAAAIGALPAAAAAASLPGALTPVPGTGGCTSLAGSGGCATGSGLDGARNLAVSPDGRNVYVSTSGGDDTLLTFDRNAVTGAVTQKPGAQGCIQDTAAAVQLANCGDAIALDDSRDLEVSPDGRNVYVASRLSNAVAVFDRDASTGALTQKAGTLGCVRSTSFAANGCSGARSLAEPFTLVVSPDGSTVHVNSFSQDGIATLKREADGSLTAIATADGCITETGALGCRDGSGLVGPRGLAISPDGTTVYNAALGAGAGAVTVFDRSPATGGLTQKAGQDGCLSETGNAGACRASALLQGFSGNGFGQVAVAPGGRTVWAGSLVNGGAVAGLPRDLGTGQIGATPSTGELCMTGSRPPDIDATTPNPAEACTDGIGLNSIFELGLSPDGRSLYVNSGAPGGLGSIDIDPATGRLSQRPGLGCTSPGGTFLNELCTPAHPAMAFGATQIVVSPDNRHVYAASGGSDGLFAFARDLPPSCRDDARVIEVGGAAPMTLSCTDPNGDAVAFGVASQPSSGVLGAASFSPTGSLTYIPDAGFTGIDQFTFKATTANGGESDPARVIVLVRPQQAGPPGAPGPQGPKGDPAFKLQAAFISEAVKATAGRAVSLRYLSTVAASATLEVRRGAKRVARVAGRAVAGRNRIVWNGKAGRQAARGGRYTLVLTLRAGGQAATDRVAATVSATRRR